MLQRSVELEGYLKPYEGKKTVKICTFGKRMDGKDGHQGSITGSYTYEELRTYLANTLKQTGYDQAKSIRFEIEYVGGSEAVYIFLPLRTL